jgi:uncharacterized membrane protein YfcA
MSATLLGIPLDWLFAGIVIGIGAFLQGVGGIGFGMFAAPVIAMVRPDLVPGPMLMVSVLIAALSAVREREHIDRSGLAIALAGRMPTAIAAAMLMGMLPVKAFCVVFALIILAGIAMSLSGVRVPLSPRNLFAAGLLSGFMGTITSVGLPPIALLYQHAAAARLRATIGGYLFVGTLISIGALFAAGRFGMQDVMLGAGLILPMTVGFLLSNRVAPYVPHETMRLIVLGLSAVAAVLLLVRQFV